MKPIPTSCTFCGAAHEATLWFWHKDGTSGYWECRVKRRAQGRKHETVRRADPARRARKLQQAGESYRRRKLEDPQRFTDYERKRYARDRDSRLAANKEYRTSNAYAVDMKQREYWKQRPAARKWKSYVAQDKQRGLDSLTRAEAEALSALPCHYCGNNTEGGLDRKNNSLGHTVENVVPCCTRCNLWLVDVPFVAKDALAPSIYDANKRGLFGNWVPGLAKKYYSRKKGNDGRADDGDSAGIGEQAPAA